VKSSPFRLLRPSTIDEALSLKVEYGEDAMFLAGGQSLLPMLNMRLARPEVLIDINGLSELSGISDHGDSIRIGALTRTSHVGRSDLVATSLPLLRECVPHIAHEAIRNLGTFGGSVALADQAAEWPAACLALGASIVLRSIEGKRSVPVSDYFRGLYSTARRPDELLVHIDLPYAPEGAKTTVLEFCRRRGDFAIVGLVAQSAPDRRDVRLVYFGIGDRPIRLQAAEDALAKGEAAARLAEIVDAELKPDGDLYHDASTKIHLAKVLLRQAAERLAG
jgi:aerobic carbon-monoxide dehydrogenase medium subunit